MKAIKDFVVYVDKDSNLVSHSRSESLDGKKKISVKKGETVPEEIVQPLLTNLPDYLEIEIKQGRLVIPEKYKRKKNIRIKKLGYTREQLNNIYNEKKMKGLREIGSKFDPPIVDRSAQRLIAEILKAEVQLRK